MPNQHHEKWVFQSITGTVLILLSVLFLFYNISQMPGAENWLMWGVATAGILLAGIFFVCNAFLHRLKHQLKRKQRRKQYAADEIEN